MKNSLLALMFIFLISNTQAQIKPKINFNKNMSNSELGQYYKQKSKNQKITAWIMLGGGLTLDIIGINKAVSEMTVFSGPVKSSNTGETLFVIGTVSALLSIPLFISSSRNKQRARILLSNHKIPLSFSSEKNNSIQSIGIGIQLGH